MSRPIRSANSIGPIGMPNYGPMASGAYIDPYGMAYSSTAAGMTPADAMFMSNQMFTMNALRYNLMDIEISVKK